MATHPDDRFGWTRFYMEFADKLLAHRENREPLVEAVRGACANSGIDYLNNDQYEDRTTGPYQDICPFSAMASFNFAFPRIQYDLRDATAQELGRVVGVAEPAPSRFQGIPTINWEHSPLFGFSRSRSRDSIDALWQVFEDAIRLSDSDGERARRSFVDSYNRAIRAGWQDRRELRVWNLTLGLSWARPWAYPSIYRVDARELINDLGIARNLDRPLSGSEYLELVKELKEHFHECPLGIQSFPELSAEVYRRQLYRRPPLHSDPDDTDPTQPAPEPSEAEEYSVEDIVSDGCFVEQQKLEMILHRLSVKKNLILQGPPGTGKTWLAKKLAFALIGRRDESRVRRFQFHPNMSYEDFIRGYRPDGEGRLTLIDGPFLKMVNDAGSDPDNSYVMVIEEINRGNPAQIFGEMLTLLEADKRGPDEALALSYSQPGDEPVHVPPNVYVIGTMNLADRSIAMVDFALRRRFVFMDLEPVFDERWRRWVHENFGLGMVFLRDIGRGMAALNERISDDRSLGPQFRIGHSVVIPTPGTLTRNQGEWFKEVVETEIGPLLDEYWFDDVNAANNAKSQLLSELDL